MTAPRTDPQSNVPVEPLSGHVWRTKTSIRDGSKTGRFVVDWEEAEAALDAARASQPITATAGLRLAVERLKYWTDGGRRECWCPPDWDHGYHTDSCLVVQAAVAEYNAAALPVREDEPTGIDDWTRLAEAWANVMDGRRIGGGLGAYRIGRHTTTTDDWHAIAAEYDRLTREASHVR
jgi:hypothetical protein